MSTPAERYWAEQEPGELDKQALRRFVTATIERNEIKARDAAEAALAEEVVLAVFHDLGLVPFKGEL